VIVIGAAASALDLLYLAQSLLDGFVRLLLFLLLYRLYTRRSLRDGRDVGFLSFFMLVAASSVTFDVAFLFIFLVFLVLGVWAFMLHHILTEADRVAGSRAAAATARAPLAPPLLALSVAASVATLAATAAFFFIIPRVGQAALPLRARLGAMVSGFSDHVELGAFGEIETNSSVVMRVRFPDGPAAPERLANLRWRGIAFDHFDGHSWTVDRPQVSALPRSGAGLFDVSSYRGVGPFVTQEIYLEPIGTERIFAAPRLLKLGLATDAVRIDEMGSVSVTVPSARLRYIAHSELEPATRQAGRDPVTPAASNVESLDRYLRLPPTSPRVGDLARAVSAGSHGPSDAALRLTRFLSNEFRYTLALSRQTQLRPLEEFLFVRRSGNCEYFATALAIMLRSIGIPARLVNGFQRGEWNPYGRYFIVRQRDAHSWVEAYIDRIGWVTLDPSPRAGPGAGPSPLGLYLDALRLRWYRYVVNWSLRDQMSIAAVFQRETSTWRQRLFEARRWGDLPPAGAAWVALVAGVVALLLWRRLRPSAAQPTLRVPRFYQRALRTLARRGLHPARGETVREFLARVGAAAPACAAPLARLTAGYEQTRFGSAELRTDELAALDLCLAELERPAVP